MQRGNLNHDSTASTCMASVHVHRALRAALAERHHPHDGVLVKHICIVRELQRFGKGRVHTYEGFIPQGCPVLKRLVRFNQLVVANSQKLILTAEALL